MTNEIFEQIPIPRYKVVFSGLPPKTYFTHNLHTFDVQQGRNEPLDGLIKAAAMTRIFLTPDKRMHHFLTFGGEPGLGKTHLAFAIAWYWMEQDWGLVRYWQVADFLEAIRGKYYQNEPKGGDRKGPLEWAYYSDLLVLDDLGAEKETEWATEKLDSLINKRWLEDKFTVFTTNLNFSQLPKRVASRLKEGVCVLLDGDDYRGIKAQQRKKLSQTKTDLISNNNAKGK